MDSKTRKSELGRTSQTQVDSDVETDRYQAPEGSLGYTRSSSRGESCENFAKTRKKNC